MNRDRYAEETANGTLQDQTTRAFSDVYKMAALERIHMAAAAYVLAAEAR